MLRYYSYYNVGGYKDMFLGDSTMSYKSTYFLPLLPIWKKKAEEGDTALAEKVKSLEKLPQINLVTIDSDFNLPKPAVRLISHAGYKVYLSRLSTGESIFAIRDIDSNNNDETGRDTPFLLLIVGDTDTDRTKLEKLAAYSVCHINEISDKLASLFAYNVHVNGIEFSLQTLNELIDDISSKSDNSFMTISKDVIVNLKKKEVALYAIPEGLNKTIAMKEHNLKGKSVNFVMMPEIIPLDDPEKMNSMLALRQKNNSSELVSIFSNKKLFYIICGAIIAASILYYFFY